MPNEPEKKARRVPRGPALDSSDEELDAAAEITPEDIEQAKEAGRRHGSGTDVPRLLEAEPEQ